MTAKKTSKYAVTMANLLHDLSVFGHQSQHVKDASRPWGTITTVWSQCGHSE